jgi:hypothetical protein
LIGSVTLEMEMGLEMLYDILKCKSSSFMSLLSSSGLDTLFGKSNIGHDRLADSEYIANRFNLILGIRGQPRVFSAFQRSCLQTLCY